MSHCVMLVIYMTVLMFVFFVIYKYSNICNLTTTHYKPKRWLNLVHEWNRYTIDSHLKVNEGAMMMAILMAKADKYGQDLGYQEYSCSSGG